MYFEVLGFVQYGVPDDFFYWLGFLAKLGLGYLCYWLYTRGNKEKAWLGAGLAAVLLAGMYTVYFAFPDISNYVGEHFPFLIAANSMFAYHYFTDSSALSRHRPGFDLPYLFIIAIIAGLAIWTQNAIEDIALLVAWIFFYLRTEGVL